MSMVLNITCNQCTYKQVRCVGDYSNEDYINDSSSSFLTPYTLSLSEYCIRVNRNGVVVHAVTVSVAEPVHPLGLR